MEDSSFRLNHQLWEELWQHAIPLLSWSCCFPQLEELQYKNKNWKAVMLPANCCWCSSSVIFWIAKKKKLTYWRKMDTGMNHKLIYYETSQTSLAFLQQSCLGGFYLQRAVDLERTVLTSYFLFLSIEVLCFFFFFFETVETAFLSQL